MITAEPVLGRAQGAGSTQMNSSAAPSRSTDGSGALVRGASAGFATITGSEIQPADLPMTPWE